MYTLKTKIDTPTHLDEVITKVLAQMSETNSGTPEFAAMADQLTKLYKLKEIESPSRVSPDTLAVVAGNLAGILMILNFERVHIVTSKAIGFVLKPR